MSKTFVSARLIGRKLVVTVTQRDGKRFTTTRTLRAGKGSARNTMTARMHPVN